MIRIFEFDALKPEEILNRDLRAEKNVEDVVDAIIADVRARGDAALKDYAKKFDGAELDSLEVTQEEIDAAFAGMDEYFLETLRQAAIDEADLVERWLVFSADAEQGRARERLAEHDIRPALP